MGSNFKIAIMKYVAMAALIVAIVYILAPLYFMFQISIGEPSQVLAQHPPLFVTDLTIRHWSEMLSSGNIWAPLMRSVAIATISMIGTILIATPAAYVISRLSRASAYTIVVGLLLTRMIPEVSIALPVSIAFLRIGLLDTYVGVALAHMIRTLPLVTWILVATFRSIPLELEDAAKVDGCSRWGTLRYVVLPLAAPGLAVSCIFSWLESWNEFLYALYLTLLKPTMPVQILYYVQRGSWFNSAVYTMVLIIPVLLVVLLFQRRIRTEYLTVGLKG